MEFPFKLRADARFDVVGFGTNAVDYLISVPEYPAFDSKLEISGYMRQAGGEVASTLAGLARLGLSTAYAGRFGDDEPGRFGLQALACEGVDVTYAETAPQTATQVGFILIDKRTGERTVLWQRDRGLEYAAGEAPLGVAPAGRVLHMTPHDTAACVEMARTARAAGTIVSVDADKAFPGIVELLPLVDVLTAAPAFAEAFTGREGAAAVTELQQRFGCPLSVMTLGREGSLAICEGIEIRTPGFDVPGGCRDTTGAGDAFRCGLLYGLLSGLSIEESLTAANAVAALKCRAAGARAALPTADELGHFLASAAC
jgi:sulfofructose kinase